MVVFEWHFPNSSHISDVQNKFCDQISMGNTGVTKQISLLPDFSGP